MTKRPSPKTLRRMARFAGISLVASLALSIVADIGVLAGFLLYIDGASTPQIATLGARLSIICSIFVVPTALMIAPAFSLVRLLRRYAPEAFR